MIKQLLIVLLGLSLSSVALAAKPPTPTWGFEIRLGTYQPALGTGAEADYYSTVFDEKEPLMKGIEVERYFNTHAGLIGVFGGASHWGVSGKTRVCDDGAGNTIACTGETVFESSPGTDTTSLTAMPLTFGAVYRMDLLERMYEVPVVPYAKLGADYFLYWIGGGSSTVGSGGTLGYHGALGIDFGLDWLEPTSKLRPFIDSYIFVEYTLYKVDGFSDSTKLDFSGSQWNFGLAFDFD